MRILKTHVLLRFLNSYLVDNPEPANISYLWNFGSLLAVCLIIQILTGAFLAMHYTPNVDFAFNSVEHENYLPWPLLNLILPLAFALLPDLFNLYLSFSPLLFTLFLFLFW